MTLAELRSEFATRQAALNALVALGDAMTAEQVAQGNTLSGELQSLQAQINELNTAQTARQALSTAARELTAWASTSPAPTFAPAVVPATTTPPQYAHVVRSRITSFSDRDGQSKEMRAYQFGQWLSATLRGNPGSRAYCKEHGIPLIMQTGDSTRQFAHVENVNSTGGFLVPPQWEQDLIDLREQYGTARRICKNRSMASDSLSVPRRTGGLAAYFITDAVAITESTKNWDLVTLVAKKVGVLAKYSSELGEDAMIDMGNDLAGEISYAFAKLEDDCAFKGDGTSTYGGMVGVPAAFTNLSGTIANIAGLYVGAGNLWSELTLADFNATKGKLPAYAAASPNTVWVCSQAFWASVMEKLALAAGGITDAMIVAGVTPRFLGYPVRITQSMPLTEANSQVCAMLGDFTLGCSFGDRRMTTIALSEHSDFATDQIAVRGTERFDFVAHDVGNAHATAASRVPGPIVGLITAAS